MSLPPYKLVTSQSEWQSCLADIQSQSRFSVDLEANSMYAYRERICLIQISSPTLDYIVDPLADIDLSILGQLFADHTIEKIFHAAEYDITLMKREHQWELNNLFDTMWAARILGYERYGLASMLETVFDVRLNKRYQKSNWCRRPLKDEQLAYAQNDTHYLIPLRNYLAEKLEASGRWEEAVESFAMQTQVTPSNNEFTPQSFWSINGARDLDGVEQSILCQLAIYRDKEAQKRDKPHFKILGDKTLLEIAYRMPRNSFELSRIHGMSAGQVRRYGQGILNAIIHGQQTTAVPPPKRKKRPPDDIINRYEKLRIWRKERAQDRGVESDVIISKDAMWVIARENPQSFAQLAKIDEIGAWRCQTYGNEILALMDKTN